MTSPSRNIWLAVALLWLAGNGLRITILAVPPVIALIRDEFALNATGVGGLVFDIGPMTKYWAALLGFPDAGALILGLALPALLCRPEDVARTAAGTFTLSYGGAVFVAIVCGAAWDLSGRPAFAFVPLAACALTLIGSALLLRAKRNLA